MRKIRINELARELEVKAHEILDRLPELGVTEKKTHSSSIDEDVAIKLRQYYGHDVSNYETSHAAHGEAETNGSFLTEAEPHEETSAPEAPSATAPAEAAPAAHTSEGAEEPEQSTHKGASPVEEQRVISRLRPPLSGRPVQPPLHSATPSAHPAPSAPAAKSAPGTPAQTPPALVFAPGRPASTAPPARPVPAPPPAPKPGQILSGPRQPLPAESASLPGPRTAPAAPGAPVPRPAIVPRPARPAEPARASGPAPASPGPTPVGPPPNRPLAGQPAARPVVPPRPDLVAKLGGPRPAMPAPPTPGQPRPGVPRPQASPVPGQPIYRGPIRPGQPMVAKTGIRPTLPGQRPAGPRPQHPTSRGRLEPGIAPPVVEQPRGRAGEKRPARPQRERVEEEKILRPERRKVESGPPPINREITISEGITVKELSEKLDVKASLLIKKLLDKNIFATINQTLDAKLASDLAREFGASTATVSYEEEAMQAVELAENPQDLQKRPPVVTVMGHVDHGKTSLLDGIREANVAAREAGGITQHIGAYQVEIHNRKIVFIDTPGHEAFTRMRARGAKVTDVVVLVVAADDGVMPQTIEAIDHARAAGVPIIVAINKIDRLDAQPERIKQQLADRGLLAEDWGGDTVMVPVSAKTHQNLELLLEMILLVADLQDLKANPSRPAMGNVIEAQLDRGRGPVATVLVRNGTLNVGDFFICGAVFGKVRAMLNDRGVPVRKAEPSTPVEVLGLDSLPEVGDDFQVVTDTAKAKQ
ncbi:MAG: translation initiation factor IF-2, partial [Acidobacteriia bacterium]|nr:translation initiation factor IF-2 [Terriglobia bacterium]